MNIKQSRSAIDSMLSGMAEITSATVTMNRVEPLDNGIVRVVATVSNAAKNTTSAMEAIASHIGNRLRPIHDSFVALSSDAGSTSFSGFFAINQETRVVDDAFNGFRAVASNMFMDEEDKAWALNRTEAGNVMIRVHTRDDENVLSGMIEAVSRGDVGSRAYEGLASQQQADRERTRISGGDYVMFVHPQHKTVQFGAIAADVVDPSNPESDNVLAVAGDGHVTISRRNILSVIPSTEIVEPEGIQVATAGAMGHSFDDIVSYYRQVFQRRPEYAEMFLERWKKHSFFTR